MALHNAARNGNFATVRQLVNAGANINARHNNMTPLMYAAGNGRANIVRYLISKGANTRARVSQNNTRSALHFAAESRNTNTVRALIRHSNLNVKDGNGRTPLMIAINLQTPEIARMLIRAGARFPWNNATNEWLSFVTPNERNMLGGELARHALSRRPLRNKLREAALSRRRHAMRGQLAHAGIPRGIRNVIAGMMRRR